MPQMRATFRVETDGEIKGNEMNQNYCSASVPPGNWKVDKVHLKGTSHDQGWASGEGSFTWVEVSVLDEADNKEVTKRHELYKNDRATHDYKEHEVTLDSSHEIVKELKSGRKVVLWARAEYSGWTMHIKKAVIELELVQ